MNQRIVYIDIARGLGILLVALGHIPLLPTFVLQFVYAFHMPLFFFISGYFLNTSHAFIEVLKKRFHSLLKPYITITVLVYFFYVSFGKLGLVTSLGRLAKSLYAAGEYVVWLPLWFLPHLFLVSIFAFLILRFHESILKNTYLYWLFLLVMLSIGVLTIDTFSSFNLTALGHSIKLYGLPLSADLLLVSSFFFLAGEQVRSLVSEKWLGNWFLLLGAGLILVVGSIYTTVRLDMNSRVYPSLLFTTIQAFVGIWFVLALSRQLELWGGHPANSLIYLGQISLIILIFHYPIQSGWMPKIEEIIGITWLAQLLAFLSGIMGSVLVYEIFIRQNRTASWWLGMKLPETEA